MIKKILFLFFVVFAVALHAQNGNITGTVKDANDGLVDWCKCFD